LEAAQACPVGQSTSDWQAAQLSPQAPQLGEAADLLQLPSQQKALRPKPQYVFSVPASQPRGLGSVPASPQARPQAPQFAGSEPPSSGAPETTHWPSQQKLSEPLARQG
jgi:hypothetical protein